MITQTIYDELINLYFTHQLFKTVYTKYDATPIGESIINNCDAELRIVSIPIDTNKYGKRVIPVVMFLLLKRQLKNKEYFCDHYVNYHSCLIDERLDFKKNNDLYWNTKRRVKTLLNRCLKFFDETTIRSGFDKLILENI
jgi:hypothetical protein